MGDKGKKDKEKLQNQKNKTKENFRITAENLKAKAKDNKKLTGK